MDISGGLRTNNATTDSCTARELRGNSTASNSGKICSCLDNPAGGATWKCATVS